MPDLTERTEIEMLALETGWRIRQGKSVTEIISDRYRFTAEFADGVTTKASLTNADGYVLIVREAGYCEGSVGDWLKTQLERWQIAYNLGNKLRGEGTARPVGEMQDYRPPGELCPTCRDQGWPEPGWCPECLGKGYIEVRITEGEAHA